MGLGFRKREGTHVALNRYLPALCLHCCILGSYAARTLRSPYRRDCDA